MRIRYLLVSATAGVLLVASGSIYATDPNQRAIAGLALALALAFGMLAAATAKLLLNQLNSIAAGVDAIHGYCRDAFEARAEEAVRELLRDGKYADARRLAPYERKIYSQGGEDGILAEIFRRIGIGGKFFVEFGVSDGSENNTVWLLENGWSGVWIEGDSSNAAGIRSRCKEPIQSGRLTLLESFITAENITALFEKGGVPEEFDLLSIDIDGNDFHVWRSLSRYRPRVVVLEYNATFPPPAHWVLPYDAARLWDGSSQFGASLAAFDALAASKGYRLVGCNLEGTNAFFVRDDLVGHRFFPPYDAETHYEPPRYYLVRRSCGHPRKV